MTRPWALFSSSSGETFRALWQSLSTEAKTSFMGYYADRESPGVAVATELLGKDKVQVYPKKDFTSKFLEVRSKLPEDLMILLCGFKAILPGGFLDKINAPVVNLHPSLLPAFPGLDEKVHQEAFNKVTLSGFSIHLVDDTVDGGPVLYQHPVSWLQASDWQQARQMVRAAEQKHLPQIWENILVSQLKGADRLLDSSLVKSKVQWSNPWTIKPEVDS